MSTSNPPSVLINVTMATLLNLTGTTETDLQNFSGNTTTLNPLYNSSIWPLNPLYNNSIWNSTYWNPLFNDPTPFSCPTCYPQFVTNPPPTDDYTYTYLYYGFVLLLLFISILCIKLRVSRQKQAQNRAAAVRRTARQQAENSYGSTQNCTSSNEDNSCHMGPKELDYPPAYDEVMKSYLMAKQQQNNTNEGAVGFTATTSSSQNNLSTTAISTLTIDTEIPNSNCVSVLDLNTPTISSMTAATTRTTEVVVDLSPPSYESSIEMANAKINNVHIV